jgi:hypothetical protein
MKDGNSLLPTTHLARTSLTFCFVAAVSLFVPAFSRHGATTTQVEKNLLKVHEWGTFTSISGPDGRAMDWLPLTGSTDLPCFVEHLVDPHFKGGLRGTVRMETPVLYFYSPRETSVSVHVSLAKGLITEWYPRAISVSPVNENKVVTLYDPRVQGGIHWDLVHIQPGTADDFPSDRSQNHYYAARHTSSSPLTVETTAGPQRERFLFYRGVSTFSPPLMATVSGDGTVLLQNQGSEDLPSVVLFERRGSRLAYRILGPLSDQASLTVPSSLDGSFPALFSDLEGILVSQGLYPDEAHAMLETWKDSWFEEGSRVIYLLPRSFVDSVLPLQISPSPAAILRVFVGRLELVTPGSQQAVEAAIAANDRATLAKYSRFFEPIVRFMLANSTDPRRTRLLERQLENARSVIMR